MSDPTPEASASPPSAAHAPAPPFITLGRGTALTGAFVLGATLAWLVQEIRHRPLVAHTVRSVPGERSPMPPLQDKRSELSTYTPPLKPKAPHGTLTKNLNGFPDERATLLCDNQDLRLAVCSDDHHLMLQAIVWQDHENPVVERSGGKENASDGSMVYLRTASAQTLTPQVDRRYHLGVRGGQQRLTYQIELTDHSRSTIKDDSAGRATLQHLPSSTGEAVRVETYVIPLIELGKKPGEQLWLRFSANSPSEPFDIIVPRSLKEYLPITLSPAGAPALDTAQVATATPQSPQPATLSPPVEWEDTNGRKVTAELVALDDDDITLRFNGSLRRLPLRGFSPASQAQARALAASAGKAPAVAPPAVPLPATAPKAESTVIRPHQVKASVGELLDLKFTAVDGRAVDLSALRGKVVLIDFWATWCGPCLKELPNVLKTYEKLHDQGFEIVGISLDYDKERLLRMVEERRMTWPQHFDGEGWQSSLAKRFGVRAVPSMWLVGKDGRIASLNARDHLEAEVLKLLAQ